MENYRKIKPFNWLLFIGILLVGANLRAPITSIGVALPDIKTDLAMSNSAVSVITVVPLLAFAVISFSHMNHKELSSTLKWRILTPCSHSLGSVICTLLVPLCI